MAAENEKLKSVIGIPDPKTTPDNTTLRAVIGIPGFPSDSDITTGAISNMVAGMNLGMRMGM